MDGSAVMKVIKHCHEETQNALEVAQGALLGLVVDNRLEITNCFPFPKFNDNDSMDEEEYQLSMMRRLRMVNVDHFHVGWYQSADLGNFLSTQLVESQFGYQTSIEESVVVIYDPQRTSRGSLSLRAYRMTPQAIGLYKEQDFTPEAIRNHKLSYESLFQEVPIVLKNSHLINALQCELKELVPEDRASQFLDLGTASVLETHLRCMMDRVDELNQEATKFNRFQHQVIKQQQDKHKYQQKKTAENASRHAKGEANLPDEDISKMFRPIPPPPRLNPMVISGQISNYTNQISQFCSQSLAKLFITESLQMKE